MRGLMMDYPLVLTSVLQRAQRISPRVEVVSRLESGALQRYTYADFFERVVRLMDVLRDLGVRPGERVGTFAWNSHRHLELYFAIPCLGAVLHTINVRLTKEQLAYIVGHAGDELIFADASLLDALVPLAGSAEAPRIVVLEDERRGAERAAALGISGAHDYETLLARASPRPDFPNLDEHQAAGLCYTSGTTGEPKGVLYSHRSQFLHALAAGMVDSMAVSRADTVMPVVPMFHANAWGFPFAATLVGAKQVFPGAHLAPGPLAELIERERVTFTAGVPTIWNLLLAHLRKEPRDVSSLRTMIVGGSAAPRALIRGWQEEQGVRLTHAWGMTETSPVGCCSRPDDQAQDEETQLSAIEKQGIPVPGIEVRIEDEQGAELPWDGASAGELCVRGPWVASAYFGDDSRAEAFANGWFHTGDVATIDPDGAIAITDRKKDLIKSRGEWISSVDLENAAMAHPGVLEAAATGRQDAVRGEVPVLWVVMKEGAELDAVALLEFLSERLPRWMLPRLDDVRPIESIPKTSVGKFDKKVLRRRLAGERLPES